MPNESTESMTDSKLSIAWNNYYKTIQEMQQLLENSSQYKDTPEQRAKGFHALFEAQAMAYNFAMAPRLSTPRIFRNTTWQTELYTLGGNGPDFDYRQLFIDGTQTYRLHGNMRDSRLVLVQTSDSLAGTSHPKANKNYDFRDFEINDDGSFEVILSAEHHDGNWIELYPNSTYNWLHFRLTVDTAESVAAELNVERITPLPLDHYAAEEFDPEAVARRIDIASGWFRYMCEEWIVNFYPNTLKMAGGHNTFNRVSRELAGEVGSDTAAYEMGTFDLADDEALYLEMSEEPTGIYWGFQIFNVWLRSLDFMTRQSTLNEQQVTRDPDGKFRLVIAHQDPGTANWLDTTGYNKGMTLLRNYGATKPAVIVTKLVKFSELESLFPKDINRVTPAERTEILEKRRKGYLMRHGE